MDDASIHLGPERYTFDEMFASARASEASLRIFILDGCLSGAVTRKGVRRVGPARVLRPRPRPAEGEVVLTSTSPDEDALESDRLEGSFFTHFLVSGLRGAADTDADGRVSVEEVARFAHDRTAYATAGSPTGSQHPSFKLDLSGTGTAVLTRPGEHHGRGAVLRVTVPTEGVAYLLREETGQLEAEISLRHPGTLVVPPGAYRVRVATARRVEEGRTVLTEGEEVDLEAVERSPVSLANLVRKGEGTASVQELAGRRKHDGFFLRLSLLGVGFSHSTVSNEGTDVVLSGFCNFADFALGYAIIENLILHANVYGPVIYDPTLEVNHDEMTLKDGAAYLMGYGGGITYYFMPVNIYATLAAGAARIRIAPDEGPELGTEYGFSMQVIVGKEWWVGDNWGLGIAGTGVYQRMEGTENGPIWTTFAGGLMFSVTYN
jgi:hypothetical protein